MFVEELLTVVLRELNVKVDVVAKLGFEVVGKATSS